MIKEPTWVDKDAFVLPEIPEELGIDPVLTALLHAAAFLELSGDQSVDPDWAVEALEHVAHYIQRVSVDEVSRLGKQLHQIADFGRSNGWPADVTEFVSTFFETCGVENVE